MGVQIQFAPVEPDKGTGEVSQALAPTTHTADDVSNVSTGEVSHSDSTTYEADALERGSVDVPDAGPQRSVADWPIPADDKTVSADKAEAKAAPAKKAPAKSAAATKAAPAKKGA